MREVRSAAAGRGQISIEYILILGFLFAILIPGILFFYSYSRSSASGVESGQYAKLGQQMLSTALESASQGQGSWLTLDADIPKSVADITVVSGGAELVISYQTGDGSSEAVFFSDTTLSANNATTQQDGSVFLGSPRSGLNRFRFEAGPNGVVGVMDQIGAGCTEPPVCPGSGTVACGDPIEPSNGCGSCPGTGTYCAAGTCQNGACCGDAVAEPPEECDAPDLGGQTCAGLGYGNGTLACTAACLFDTSGCCSDTCAVQGEIQCSGFAQNQYQKCDYWSGSCLSWKNLNCSTGYVCNETAGACVPEGPQVCGDAVVQPPEECDSSMTGCPLIDDVCGLPQYNDSPDEACQCLPCKADGVCYLSCPADPDCRCGDGVCDWNKSECATCPSDCTGNPHCSGGAVCGDGIITPPEQCDPAGDPSYCKLKYPPNLYCGAVGQPNECQCYA